MTRIARSLLALAPLFALAACEVNHMPAYAPHIQSASIEATVTGDIEIEILEPALEDAYGNLVPVVDPTADRLVDRFIDRVGARIVSAELGLASADVFQYEAAHRMGWDVDPRRAQHDARFIVDVDDLEIVIDDWGFPSLEVHLKVEGWYTPTGTLIYREYTQHDLPLLYADELLEPWDPGNIDDVMGARAENLITLDRMPDAELRARVYMAIEDTAAIAAGELQRATGPAY